MGIDIAVMRRFLVESAASDTMREPTDKAEQTYRPGRRPIPAWLR